MKRHLTFIMLLVCAITSAQNSSDVLRYGNENITGTARFQGMGGAFGALGGDLSALNINPAGSAVFNNSLFTITGNVSNTENDASYFNGRNTSDRNSTNINQAGGILVFKSSDESNWKKISLAFNYDMVQNFDNRLFVNGNGTEGIANYFLNFAQGAPFGDIILQDGEFIEDAYLNIGAQQGFADQQAFLGYFGGLIDPVDADDDNNTAYVSNAILNNGNVEQTYLQNTSGYNNKFTLNIGTQYREQLYLGASLNFHGVIYNRVTEFTETGYDSTSEIQRTIFDNNLLTEGAGFSLSVGAIAKLNQFIRVGASYQSPTWYRLTDNLSQRINSDLADENINFINFNLVNVFEPYTIKTPQKLTGSLAVIFGKNGLLSFDYGYQDMSQSEIRPTNDPNFSVVNSDISNQLGAVSTFRLGGEFRIQQFSLRGGYRYEESPYNDGLTIGDLTGVSGGIGYDFGGSRLDLAFNRTEQDVNQRLSDTGITTPARINTINTNLVLGYTLNF